MLIFGVCISIYISIGAIVCFIYINLDGFFEQYLDLRDRHLRDESRVVTDLSIGVKEKILDAAFLTVTVLLWPLVLIEEKE